MVYVRAEARPGQLVREWSGDLVAEETTRTDDRVRWVEFRVYRLRGGRWLAHTAGMSAVYHRASTACRTASNRKPGAQATVEDLPDDAEPCSECAPPYPGDLADGEVIRYEFPRHSFAEGTPEDLVYALTHYRVRETGAEIVRVSEPVEALLGKLAKNAPEFSGAPQENAVQGDDDEGYDLPARKQA